MIYKVLTIASFAGPVAIEKHLNFLSTFGWKVVSISQSHIFLSNDNADEIIRYMEETTNVSK